MLFVSFTFSQTSFIISLKNIPILELNFQICMYLHFGITTATPNQLHLDTILKLSWVQVAAFIQHLPSLLSHASRNQTSSFTNPHLLQGHCSGRQSTSHLAIATASTLRGLDDCGRRQYLSINNAPKMKLSSRITVSRKHVFQGPDSRFWIWALKPKNEHVICRSFLSENARSVQMWLAHRPTCATHPLFILRSWLSPANTFEKWTS